MRVGRTCCAVLIAALAPHSARAANLESVLAEVAARNPMILARAAEADAARERSRQAGAWEAPMLELGVVNVPTTLRFDEDAMTMKTIGVRQRISPSAALERRAGREGAVFGAEQARLTRQEMLGAAVEAYVAAWSAGERVAAAERHLTLLTRAVESARARYGAGNGRIEDVLRVRSEEARMRASLAHMRAEQRTGRLRLSSLRGLAPEFEGEPLEAPRLAPVPDEATPWMAAVDETHPKLRAGDAAAARYRFEAGAARAGLWPMLDLMYEYGYREDLSSAGHLGESEQDNMFSARVGLSLPVFAAQRELREAAEMEAMARAADHERRAANLDLLEGVAMAHEEARAGIAVARLLADTVLVAERAALDAAWSSYGAGAMELARVVDTAHALYDDELELVRAREQAMRSQGRMLALTGRGDLIGVALPVTTERRP